MKKQISFILLMFLPGLIFKGFASMTGELPSKNPEIPKTYTWKGASGGSWTTPANWSPQRIQPSAVDILIFNLGYDITVMGVPDETIGQLKVMDHTSVTLLTGSNRILNIAGLDDDDLIAEAESRLILSGSNPLQINLNPGATGRIGGTVLFSGGGHRLESRDENGLTFLAGSSFITETGFSGNPFGVSSLNSVIFESYSTYICKAGDHPFGATAPKSVVIFKEGSRYEHRSKETPSLGDRIYGCFELDHPEADVRADGRHLLVAGDLTVKSGNLFLNIAEDIEIHGNLTVNSPGSLLFRPDREIRVELNGNIPQTITGDGILDISENVQFILKNEVNINRDIYFNGAVKIYTNGIFSILPGGFVSVRGVTTNERPEGIVIHSHADGTGSFIGNGPVDGQGTAKVECFLQPGMWHYVSPPVGEATAGTFQNDYLKTSDPGSVSGWGPWIQNPAAPLDAMCGYAVWKPISNTQMESYSGRLNSGTIEIMRSRIENDPYAGWHLLGNPFPSSIDLDSRGIKWGEFEPAAWFWDQGSPGSTGNYQVYPVLLSPPPETGFHSGQVPPLQGFFAHINSNYSGKTVFSVNDDVRIHGDEPFLKKETVALEKSLVIKATCRENSYSDCIFIHFDPDCTENYDPGYDAWKLSGVSDAPQLFSYTGNGDKVSFNCLPFKNPIMTIPVGFTCNITGSFKLAASLMKSFPEDISIFLEDQLTHKIQDLRKQSEYSFYSAPANEPARFLIHFQDFGSAIPGVEDRCPMQVYTWEKAVYIKSKGYIEKGDLTVYDLTGRKLAGHVFGGSSFIRVPVQLPGGCYLARVSTEKGVWVRKIVL